MVSKSKAKAHTRTGAGDSYPCQSFEEPVGKDNDMDVESIYYWTRTPRTPSPVTPWPSNRPHPPPSNHHCTPGGGGGGGGTNRSGSKSASPNRNPNAMRGSETSRRCLNDACAPDSVSKMGLGELSVEEALLSILCESHSHSRYCSRSSFPPSPTPPSPSPSPSLSSFPSPPSSPTAIALASPFRFLPRRDTQKFDDDDLDSLPTIPSFVSVEDMEPCNTPLRPVRTRTFSTSRFVVKSQHGLVDSNHRNTRELSILKFVALIKEFCPFVQGVKIQQVFSDDEEPLFNLENYPTSLAHPDVSKQFCLLSKDNDKVHALRTLAAELYLALSFIHGHGIVHQDVKPANIMISKDGHAVLGDFGEARFLPTFGQTLRTDTGTLKAGRIVVQPNEVLMLSPVYAAPELVQRREDGVLEYDGRVDWWSYGLSLYEVVTGGLRFQPRGELLEDVYAEHEVNLVCDIDQHLHEFLRLLLVRDPASRLCGPLVKKHPFFDPLSGLWGRIKSLRYPPPCLCPPKLPFFSPPSSLQSTSHVENDDNGSDLPFGNITILQPRTTYRDSSSSDDSESERINKPISPWFQGRRTEALTIRRPTARIFDDFDESDFSRSPQSEDFDPLEGVRDLEYHSGRINPSFSMDTSCSPPQPLPSTCSIVRYHYNDGTTNFGPPILEVDDTLEHAEALDTFDGSFNDSGLHLPLSDSPESWDVIKGSTLRKPRITQTKEPLETPLLPPRSKPLGRKIDVDWTLDEEIALSLLSAGFTRDRKGAEKVAKRRLSRARTVMKASARVVKRMSRRVSHVFLWR